MRTAAPNRAEIVACIVMAWLLSAAGGVQTGITTVNIAPRTRLIAGGVMLAASAALGGALMALLAAKEGFSSQSISLIGQILLIIVFAALFFALVYAYISALAEELKK